MMLVDEQGYCPEEEAGQPSLMDGRDEDRLNSMELVAEAVSEGIASGNYLAIREQLAGMVGKAEKRNSHVCPCPSSSIELSLVAACVIMIILFAYALAIGVGAMVFSPRYFLLGLLFTAGSAVAIGVAAIAGYRTSTEIRFRGRYALYEEYLGYFNLAFTEDIAFFAKQDEERVVEDLNRAVKEKLIPQGHFSEGNLVFMVSDELFSRYEEKSLAYDRYFRKKIEERRRIESRSQRVAQILDDGERYKKKIDGYKALIGDKVVAKKVGKIGQIAAMIFHEIDTDPSHVQSLSSFLNYYLPTTEKLLDAYVAYEEGGLAVQSVERTKREIAEALDTIIDAFEGIIEKLHMDSEMDVIMDIDSMELSMRQEGLIGFDENGDEAGSR